MNSSLKGAYSRISDIRQVKHSAKVFVMYTDASRMCLVAVFEFMAASFWTPTSVRSSGMVPSLASFKPVTARIMFR